MIDEKAASCHPSSYLPFGPSTMKRATLLFALLLALSFQGVMAVVPTDTTRLDWLRDKMNGRLCAADFDSAIYYGNQLLDRGIRQGDYHYSVPQAHLCLGQAYTMKGDDANLAFDHLKKAERYVLEEHNDTLLASVLNAQGLYATNINKDYYTAMEYYLRSRELSVSLGRQAGVALADANIASICYLKKDATGITYAEECYEIGHELRNAHIIFMGASMLSFLHFLDGDYAKAMNYVKEAEFLMESNAILDKTNIYTHHGRLLHALGRRSEACVMFDKALDFRAESQVSSIIDTYCTYARLLREEGELDKAERMLCEGVSLSDSLKNEVFRGDLLKELALCYEQMGNIPASLRTYKQYMAADDSLYKADKEREIDEIRARYNLERSENAVKESRLQVMRKQRHIQWLLTVLILAAVTSLMLYHLYRRKNALYRSIVQQNMDALLREQTLRQRLEKSEQEVSRLQETVRAGDTNAASGDAVAEELPAVEKYASSSLSDEKKNQLFCQLEALMTDRAIYRDKLLTKDRVAELLGTNRTYLSQVINERTKQTFTGYINSIRIHEAVRILSDPSNNIPLKVLYGELGYSSITTFYKQFQAVTGMTPMQFRENAAAMTHTRPLDNAKDDTIEV